MSNSFNSVEEELNYYKNLSIDLEQTLNETRGALEEFQASSRELEEELEKEIEQTEKAYGDLKIKTEHLRTEVDDWKGKFQQAKHEHNTTMTKMQRDIELLKKTEEIYRKKTLDLELDYDDLERTERATTSSLADLEMKYNRIVERNVILENEIMEKDRLTEQLQRLKDDFNDANLELERLRVKTDTQESALNAAEARTHSLELKLTNIQKQQQAAEAHVNGKAETISRSGSPTKQNQFESEFANSNKTYIPRSRIPRTPGSPGGKEFNSIKMVQEMVGRVRTLEARLQSCRSLVTPLLQPGPGSSIPVASPALYSLPSPQKQAESPRSSLEKTSPTNIPVMTNGSSRPQSPAHRAGSPLNGKYRRTSLPMRVPARPDSADEGKMDES